ncbi:hypothetical protein OOT00_10540 [Desulfobotulus sp. H1]|uniref:Uncharacterized protein n=1 Tax=Desulfobotulus pelophilus TaxID=2823377 RepID=A0ABT3NAC7_9BACT|nr:hypothetical protein [Desulfobotulus pelophilus]MCW7754423.1 hypothetical protein [Desulfobotulus pelophilus]
MEPKIIAKQILDFQKALLNNLYTTAAVIQDHGEKITRLVLEPLPHVPDQNKALVTEWITNVRQGQEKVRKFNEEGFARLERYIEETP